MTPPFSITIEITEAKQCHAAVSQLLRVFPSLSLTITAHERIPIAPSTPQADHDAHIRAYVAACVASLYPRTPAHRILEVIDRACVGADSPAVRAGAETAERAAKSRAEADAIHSQNILDCNAAAAEREARAESDATYAEAERGR